jgi:hypothetical protein
MHPRLTRINAPRRDAAHHPHEVARMGQIDFKMRDHALVEESVMHLLPRSGWLRRAGIAAFGLTGAGVALAHPGHDHGTWIAEIVHLLHGLAPLLAVLAVGVVGAVLLVMARPESAGASPER